MGQSNLQIGFLFTSAYGYNCYLDNVKITATITGVENNYLGDLNVYPNPSNGLFTIRVANEFSKMNVDLIDVTGRKVYSNNYSFSLETPIDLQGLPKGMYLLKMRIDDKLVNRKIVID